MDVIDLAINAEQGWRAKTSYLYGSAYFLMLLGIGMVLFSLRSVNYVSTHGTIMQSTVDRQGTKEKLLISYRYQVEGHRYENDRIDYGSLWLRRNSALMTQYPVGSTVAVYYDRSAPSISVLEKGPTFSGLVFSLGGVGLFLLLKIFR